MSLLRYLLVSHTAAVLDSFIPAAQQKSPAAAMNISQIINSLLDPDNETGRRYPYTSVVSPLTSIDLSSSDPEIQVMRLMEMADEFSLPFCQLKLRQLIELRKDAISHSADGTQINIATALFEGAKSAVANGNTTWPIFLSVLEDGTARQVFRLFQRGVSG